MALEVALHLDQPLGALVLWSPPAVHVELWAQLAQTKKGMKVRPHFYTSHCSSRLYQLRARLSSTSTTRLSPLQPLTFSLSSPSDSTLARH